MLAHAEGRAHRRDRRGQPSGRTQQRATAHTGDHQCYQTCKQVAGYRRSFVDLGAAMRTLLEQPARLPQARPLLAAFPPRPEAAQLPSFPSSPALVEQLNERELEVLRLVAAGQSNSAIAASLIIAIGMVKKHLSNIFGKLAVGSRTQAVARARELGLL